MALVGDNGAGKSTLIKCIAGIHGYDSGEILFEGQPVTIHGPKDSAKLGIEVVYQDLALCDNLDVVQNMYLGREVHDWFYRLKEPAWSSGRRRRCKSLAVTTIRSIRQPVASLSGGQRQSVAVAQGRAVELQARHPRRADRGARRRPDRAGARARRRLAEQGLAVVLISHNLHDIFEIGEPDHGAPARANVGVYERAKTTQQEVVHAITAGVPTKVAGIPRRRREPRVTPRTSRSSARTAAGPRGGGAGRASGAGGTTTSGRATSASCRSSSAWSSSSIFFSSRRHNFFTADNFDNIIIQMAGHDDARLRRRVRPAARRDRPLDRLSQRASARSRSRSSSCRGRPRLARLIALSGLIAIPIAIGIARSSAARRERSWQDRRAVVRRDARRPPDLPGRDPPDPRGAGHDPIQDRWINYTGHYYFSELTGWIIGAVISGCTRPRSCSRWPAPAGGDRHTKPWTDRRPRSSGVGAGGLRDGRDLQPRRRAQRPAARRPWMSSSSWSVLTYLAERRFGRHVYAVGGNAEAARRAGISVPRIRILVFMISGAMAGVGGIILAANVTRSTERGGGTLLLNAIAAAVIGGAASSAAAARSASALLGSPSSPRVERPEHGRLLHGTIYIVTGIILLLAVTLDTVAPAPAGRPGR